MRRSTRVHSAADFRQGLCDVFDDELDRIAKEVGFPSQSVQAGEA
jgi:hypothetical protein